MDLLTFLSHSLLYALGASTLFVINKRVGQYLEKLYEKDLSTLKSELDAVKKRISELSIKVGLRDSFKN